MTADVETMFSAREVPWHGIGTVTEDALTASEAIVAGGLDWTVEPRSLYTTSSDKKSKVKIEGRKAIIRDKDDAVLGLVSDRYVPFQNIEAFEFADSLVDSGEAKYETAGSLRGGKVIFLTMKFPEQIMVAGEDPHDLYCVLRTSHDGTKAISAYVTPIRVVCTNTMAMAIRAAKHKWSMQHTQTLNGKLLEARETLRLSFKYAEEFAVVGTELVSIKVTADTVRDLFTDLLPARPKTDEVIDQMMALYESSPTNGYTGTAWGAFNALTEYMDHGRDTRSAEAVFGNIMDGQIAKLRNQTTKRLLALA